MTTRTRVRTPRRRKDWGNSELVTETLAANGKQLHDALGGYYSGRGVNSVPDVTVMRMIGSIHVRSTVAAGNVDVHFGLIIRDKAQNTADMPVPFIDDSDWLWQYRIVDDNFLTWDGTSKSNNFHRIDLDIKAKRRITNPDDRLFLFTFNSDATDPIKTVLSTRTLLALP